MNEQDTRALFRDLGVEVPSTAVVEFKAKCPKCKDHRKSSNKSDKPFSGNLEEGVYHCHNCGFKGNVLQKERRARAPAWAKDLPVADKEQTEGNEKAWKWLKEQRGLSMRMLIDEGVRIVPEKYFPQNDKSYRAIQFNYLDPDLGKVVKCKYRNSGKLFIQDRDSFPIPYRIGSTLGKDEVVITEGEIDALSFVEAGIDSAISLSDGSKSYESLGNYEHYLRPPKEGKDGIKRIYIATDNDDPGIAARDEIARRLGRDRCYVVSFPEDCNDPNDVLVKHGPEKLAECKERAVPFPVSGINTVESQFDVLNSIWEAGDYPEGASTGITHLDGVWRWYKGDVYVITGYPNHGKSPFVDFCALSIAARHGWKWGVFSPEYDSFAQYIMRLATQYSGKKFSYQYQTPRERDAALDFIASHFWEVRPENGNYTIENLEELIELLVRREGINGLVLDNYSNVSYGGKGVDKEEFVRNLFNRLTYIANHHSLCIVLVAHPRKVKDVGVNPEPIKGLQEVAGSSHFNNLAKGGLSIYRNIEQTEDDEGPVDKGTTVNVLKAKFERQGEPGASVDLSFDKSTERYYNKGEVIPPSIPLPEITGQFKGEVGASIADIQAQQHLKKIQQHEQEAEEDDIPF